MMNHRSCVRTLTLALLTASCLTAPQKLLAQVTPADSSTQVYDAPNGVPVVDIANPNGSGLSHNRFNEYNVASEGLILNNGTISSTTHASQLAGQVPANVNLSNSASIILNEVVQPNRSALNGYTEVVGAAADVIVANPYGITCNGCGFINTPNVTLTTGSPMMSGSALTGFRTEEGDILITGTGLDASEQDYLALVARSVKVDGQVNAKDLDIVAGENDWDHTARTATARAATGSAPAVAIDSTALGGMYANRIRLISTEDGVGVKMNGEAAAGVGDFTLDASGKIEIGGAVSAEEGSVSITSSASGNDAIKATDAKISAKNDTTLTASSGEIDLEGGTITADENLSLTSESLTDNATAGTGDNNKRYAAGNVTLTQSGAATVDGTSYGAGGSLTATANSLTLGAGGATIYGNTVGLTTTGNMGLGTAAVSADGALDLTSSAGAISTTAGAGQGIVSENGSVAISAATGLNNAGGISADNGALTARVGGTLSNSGTMHAGTALTLTDAASGGTQTITNTGTLIADSLIAMSAQTLNNNGTGVIQGGSGASVITIGGTATNASGAKIILGNASGSGAMSAATLSNSGILQSGADLALTIGSTLTNAASGKILGGGDVSVRGGSGSVYTINNAGLVQAGSLLDIKGNADGNAVNINTTASGASFIGNTLDFNGQTISVANDSDLTSAGDMTLNAQTLTMGGADSAIVAASSGTGTGNITLTGSFSNTGMVFSGDDLNLRATSISNSATAGIAAVGDLLADAQLWGFDNYGALYAGGLLDARAGTTFTNYGTGTMDSGGNIAVTAATFINNNDVNAAGNITVDATTFRNEVAGGDRRIWNTTSENHSETGWSRDPDWLVWGESATKTHTWTWQRYQSYQGGTPTNKPTMIANGAITITDFQTGLNLGGIISANTVNINTTRGGATFTNDAYDLRTENWKRTRVQTRHCCEDVIYLYDTWGTPNSFIDSTSSTPFGSAIYASTLNATGFALTNVASVYAPASVTSQSASGTSATSLASGVSFGGITVTLPTNPNGFFVVSKDPDSDYLVETNPLFTSPSAISSDYLAKRLGLNPETLQKRLGDGNYEVFLVRQQLIQSVGSNIILPGENEAQQMQRLMDQGAEVASTLGLEFGKPLSETQIAGLETDMVWMVETEVNGQKVLAPVVYLSAATKEMFASGGAMIAANDVNMDLDSLTNTGGTIQGTNTLNIASTGDITNTSGTLRGGDVSLTSREGSIVNETYAQHMGNDTDGATVIGKTAGIEATGNLNLDAAQDITNRGAQVSAGGDATLNAGGDIVFDTIEDRRASTTIDNRGGNSITGTNNSSVTESSVTNIGSGLTVGGNLNSTSGGDTVIRGSTVDVAGDGNVTAGGDLKILDVQNEHTTTSTTTTSGVGVGGGVYGTQSDSTEHYQSLSSGSSVNFGGNANLEAGGTMTVRGSEVGADGDLAIKADEVEILEGRNIDRTTQTTSTTSYLSTDSGSSSGSGAGAESGSGDGAASASASAEASQEGNADLSLMNTTTTTSTDYSNTGSGSSIRSGGNMSIQSNNDLTVRGSNVEAGGNVEIGAENVNITASQDIHTSTTTTTTTSIGLHATTNNQAGAEAHAGAQADDGGASAGAQGSSTGAGAHANAGNANASAEAGASAGASTDNTIDLMRHNETTTTTLDITNQGSSIKSGGNMTINAGNNLSVHGSDIEAGGDADLSAKDMSFTAAQDVSVTTTTSSSTAAGLYNGASADASASAEGSAGVTSGLSGSANAEANAQAESGYRVTNTTSSSTEGSTTARTSTIKSGGNMTRNAEGKILDEGTQIEAGGNFSQSAEEWESRAAENTTFSSSSTETNTGKIGGFAEAGASAGASGEAGMGMPSQETGSDAGASAGVKVTYERSTEESSSGSSQAVTSTIKAGGSMTSTTSGHTSLEGTNLESGGDMTLNAGSLDFKAAEDTSTSSSNSSNINAELKAGVDATKAVTGSIAGGYEADRESSTSSTAVTGSMKSGGNLQVNTGGDARFEGTNIESEGSAGIKAGGDVTFDAARNTSSSESSGENVSASLSASKSGKSGKGMGLEAEGGFNESSSESSEAVTGSIKAGGGLDISAGGDATFEGTGLESGGDMSVGAGGNVNFNAAESTSSSEEYGMSASISASKGGKNADGTKKGTDIGGSVSGNYGMTDETTSEAGSLKSGGNISIRSGNDTNLEGTNIESTGKTGIDAGGDVNFKAATDTSTSFSAEGEISAGKSGGGTDVGLDAAVEGGTSTTRTGGSINAGEIEINSGGNATFEGTNMDSEGDTTVRAGGDVRFDAAESSSVDGSLSGSIGTGGGSLGQAGIGGGVTQDGSNINTGGNLNIQSGGQTSFTGTQAKVGGDANIDAAGGVEKNTAVSGGGQIGTNRIGAEIGVQQTEINARGGNP